MSSTKIFLKPNKAPFILIIVLALLSIIVASYSAYWFTAAKQIQKTYVQTLKDISVEGAQYAPPQISGFPGKLHLSKAQENIQTPTVSIKFKNLHASAWPFPSFPIEFSIESSEFQTFKWKNPLAFDQISGVFNIKSNVLNITQSTVIQGDFLGTITGSIDFEQATYPRPDLIVSLKNNDQLLLALGDAGIISTRNALFINAGLNSFNKNGVVTIPITQRANTIYVGPIPVASLPDAPRQAQHSSPAQDQ